MPLIRRNDSFISDSRVIDGLEDALEIRIGALPYHVSPI